jgi:LysM repeat protein
MNKHLFLTRIILAALLFLGLALIHLTWPTQVVSAAVLPVADGEAVYVVQWGDTLSAIARRYGATLQALMAYNSLTSTTIYVGQRLLLPGANNPGPAITHVVQRGETLFRLARRYGTSVAAIKTANNLRSDTIYVGQRLLIPGVGPGNPPPGGPERIQFAPGATSATVNGAALANAPKRYLLRANVGQEMTVNLVTPSAFTYITVLTPQGGNLAGADGIIQNWTGRLPQSGDYTVEVINTAQGAANFTLQVTIVTPNGGPVNEAGEAVLEQLTVRTLESYPVQVQAVIRGQLPDACTYIAEARQRRESNTFRLSLTTARYANRRCAPALTPFEQIVPLDTVGLPAGAYNVRINQISTAFTLATGNDPNQPPATVERIRFRPGAISDTRGGSVSAVEPRGYVLRAAAGQQLTVQLKTTSAFVYLKVLTPNGDNLAASDGALQYWTGVLPVDGDYTIEVRNSGQGSADFGLTVTIIGIDQAGEGIVETSVQYVMAQADIAIHNAPRPDSQLTPPVSTGGWYGKRVETRFL